MPYGRTDYMPAERVADAAVHYTGIALALMGVPVLIVLAALLDGTGPVIASLAVYGAALLTMIGLSAAYHLVPSQRYKHILRRCDRAAIYLKIVATQTPFAVFVGGSHAIWILAALWLIAFAGAVGTFLVPARMRFVAVPLYLALGWGGAMLVWPAPDSVSLAVATMTLLIIGGSLYSIGVAFYLMRRLIYHIAIWHGFVLTATFVFYGAVIAELAIRATSA